MRMIDIIERKKLGKALTKEEIAYLIRGYVNEEIPDYQMSAFLMAVYFQGMNDEEIANLTLSMANSGDVIDLSSIKGIKVDKHSTGGVGDKISLIVIPLVASLGIPVAKLSGRGLGHTGGTIDKLESIEGFNTELSLEEFINNVNNYKMAISGQSANLNPADKKMYALRDVTGTVNSIPLIASSIMSKKIATGADAIVLDVKVGHGAFMKSIDEARELAYAMVKIGKALNKKTVAILTNMDQPLGYEVGNANEVKEAIEVLKGRGAEDERKIALTIASYMAIAGGAFDDFNEAYSGLEMVIKSGRALETFRKFIDIQGGDSSIIDNYDKLPRAKYNIEVKSKLDGFVTAIDAEKIGTAAMLLGAGRRKKEDKIDHAAGITLKKKIGDIVKAGDVLCILHTNMGNTLQAETIAEEAYIISKEKPQPVEYIYDVIK